MRVTFEYDDDEKHMVKWCLVKLASYLGCNVEDKVEYPNKASISNVWEIPEKFKDLFESSIKTCFNCKKKIINERYDYGFLLKNHKRIIICKECGIKLYKKSFK